MGHLIESKQKMPEKKARVEGSKTERWREETKVDAIIGASEFGSVKVRNWPRFYGLQNTFLYMTSLLL